MNDLSIFLWGCFGSSVVEIVAIYRYYLRGRPLPKRYSSYGFWFIRVALVLTGGGVAIGYGIANSWLAIHIGAATPLIIDSLTQKNPTDNPVRKSGESEPTG